MRKYSILLVLGLLVFITPFLGVPESWKAFFLFTLGTCIILSALTYRFTNRREGHSLSDDFYTENEPATHTIGD